MSQIEINNTLYYTLHTKDGSGEDLRVFARVVPSKRKYYLSGDVAVRVVCDGRIHGKDFKDFYKVEEEADDEIWDYVRGKVVVADDSAILDTIAPSIAKKMIQFYALVVGERIYGPTSYKNVNTWLEFLGEETVDLKSIKNLSYDSKKELDIGMWGIDALGKATKITDRNTYIEW